METWLWSHTSQGVSRGSYTLRAEIVGDREPLVSYVLGLRPGAKAGSAGRHDTLRQSWRQAPMLDVCELVPSQRLTLTSD